ncbi:acyl carrier protein [Streptomyces sp. LX-29]|uniref:acyl carrier protein n=1 Tax=Streptomyces sp. LX-29 TaxID=2900152 RepID=UPI00240D1601|nr:acyl carrier protein [Streptomyces sp. LX-29]WFB05963.1 acyl carrier protein [Streptomyces sp. LX-29]
MNSNQVQAPGLDTEAGVFEEVLDMLEELLGGYAFDRAEITMDTELSNDLDLESFDLVTLGGLLSARFGERVNFAEFLAEIDLERVIRLTVGDVVGRVTSRLSAPEEC